MKFLDTASLSLVSLVDHPPPSEYAILSYTWNPPDGKICQRDADNVSSAGKGGEDWPGHPVAAACHQARAHSIPYLWDYRLCVDRTSSADVDEAVTASFRLVWNAALCIVHLSDLLPATDGEAPLPDQEKALSSCRWFTGGWALQELVAARRIEFFDRDWILRGVKASTSPRPWLEMLSRVSAVDELVLADRDALFDVSLGRRLSWAARRQTRRLEDTAYALMGICGVGGRLTPRYGEGRHRAFFRLQKKILKTTSDLSILAWKRQQNDDDIDGIDKQQKQRRRRQPPFSGILADSAADFRHFESHPTWVAPFVSDGEWTINNRGLCGRAPLSVRSHRSGVGREVVLVLTASRRSRADSLHVGISLREVEPGVFVRSNPREIVCFPLRKGATLRRICVRCEVDDREARRLYVERKESRVSVWMDEEHKVTTGGNAVERTQNRGPAPRARWLSKRGADEMLLSDYHPSGSSSEDDILLFDSLPEKPERLEDGHHFQFLVPTLVSLGLGAWSGEKKSVPALTCTPFSIPSRPHKSARRDTETKEDCGGCGCCDDCGNWAGSYTAETEGDESDVLVVRSKNETPTVLLACPFYRFDPLRYHSCMWELELPNMNTLKQHVIVDHRLPEYCPVCHACFNSAANRDHHIIARSCIEREAPAGLLVGVSEDQVEKLSWRDSGKKWKPKTILGEDFRGKVAKRQRRTFARTEEDRWFRVWEILFPDVPRPESAYLSAPREREAAAMRRFWRKAGPGLVAGALEKRELLQWEDPREEAALAALHASVFKGMMEESGLAFQVEDSAGAGGLESGLAHVRRGSLEAI